MKPEIEKFSLVFTVMFFNLLFPRNEREYESDALYYFCISTNFAEQLQLN